eukprot:GHVT01081487.1.p1 GENE.GHVT01081487.1~~GHVT01081487.1.p1  ORF type:complete len:187 (+),score=15.42 GHVT01081487.1:3341-3901(+)
MTDNSPYQCIGAGDEPNLRQCPHVVNDDIYCVHTEDVVVACQGSGDPSGVGLFRKENIPGLSKKKFHPKIDLTCADRPIVKTELKGSPGAIFMGRCPPGCSEDAGAVKGTYIYTDDSPARAAKPLPDQALSSKKFAGQSTLPARFAQLMTPSATPPMMPPKFEWRPAADWPGFKGSNYIVSFCTPG